MKMMFGGASLRGDDEDEIAPRGTNRDAAPNPNPFKKSRRDRTNPLIAFRPFSIFHLSPRTELFFTEHFIAFLALARESRPPLLRESAEQCKSFSSPDGPNVADRRRLLRRCKSAVPASGKDSTCLGSSQSGFGIPETASRPLTGEGVKVYTGSDLALDGPLMGRGQSCQGGATAGFPKARESEISMSAAGGFDASN